MARATTARMTAFSPAQSPPLVSTPMVFPELTITSGIICNAPFWHDSGRLHHLISPGSCIWAAGKPPDVRAAILRSLERREAWSQAMDLARVAGHGIDRRIYG